MKPRRCMIPAVAESADGVAGQPPVQAYSGIFLRRSRPRAPLRECASPGCDVLHTVYQGDKVEILERTPTGWSKVRLVDRPAGIGWIPSDQLSYSPDRTTVGLAHVSCQCQQCSPVRCIPGRNPGPGHVASQ